MNDKKSDIEMKVTKIRTGTVIDHVPAGRALSILKILGVDGSEGSTALVAMNISSSRHGQKDVVKLEGMELNARTLAKIALIAPKATLNKISDYNVVTKEKIRLPEIIEETVSCINPNCISAQEREPIVSKFKVISEAPLDLECMYCIRHIGMEEVRKQLVGPSS